MHSFASGALLVCMWAVIISGQENFDYMVTGTCKSPVCDRVSAQIDVHGGKVDALAVKVDNLNAPISAIKAVVDQHSVSLSDLLAQVALLHTKLDLVAADVKLLINPGLHSSLPYFYLSLIFTWQIHISLRD